MPLPLPNPRALDWLRPVESFFMAVIGVGILLALCIRHLDRARGSPLQRPEKSRSASTTSTALLLDPDTEEYVNGNGNGNVNGYDGYDVCGCGKGNGSVNGYGNGQNRFGGQGEQHSKGGCWPAGPKKKGGRYAALDDPTPYESVIPTTEDQPLLRHSPATIYGSL